jgi:hypothetical protein
VLDHLCVSREEQTSQTTLRQAPALDELRALLRTGTVARSHTDPGVSRGLHLRFTA